MSAQAVQRFMQKNRVARKFSPGRRIHLIVIAT
jgi:hypothetical protein